MFLEHDDATSTCDTHRVWRESRETKKRRGEKKEKERDRKNVSVVLNRNDGDTRIFMV